MMTYELIESLEELHSIKDQWRTLLGEVSHTPFQEWSWHYSWWKNMGEFIGQQIFFMTVWNKSELKLVMPLSISQDGDVLQWSAGEVSDYCDVLTSEENIGLISKAMSKAFDKYSGKYVRLKQIREDAKAYGEMSKVKKLSVGDDFVCPVIHINKNGYEEWLSGIDRKTAAEANRRRRRLNEIGDTYFKEAENEDEMSTFIRQGMSDKRDWLERRGIKNILCTEKGENFLTEAFQHMFNMGYAHVTAFRCGNDTIANHTGFIYNNKFYYYFGTWNYAWKNYAPGKLFMLDLIQYSHMQGLTEFDMLRGAEEYKESYSPNTITLKKFEMEKKGGNILSCLIPKGMRKFFN